MIGIQEHRLVTTNPTEELWSEDRNSVFIYGSATNLRVGGVGFVISKSIYRCIQKVEVISERILHATFHGNPRLSITVVYAPTECGPSTAKDDFYASLAEHLEQLKRHDINLVVGDFNARIGTDSHHTNPEVVGRYCYHDQTNDQRHYKSRRVLVEINEISARSRRDLRDITNLAEISSRLTRSLRDLVEISVTIQISPRSRRDLVNLGEISPISPRSRLNFCTGTVENSPNPSSVYISGYANRGQKFSIAFIK